MKRVKIGISNIIIYKINEIGKAGSVQKALPQPQP